MVRFGDAAYYYGMRGPAASRRLPDARRDVLSANRSRSVVLGAVGRVRRMVGAGGLLEVIQAPVGRDMSLGDWLASSIGVVIGVLAFQSIAAGAAVLHRS